MNFLLVTNKERAENHVRFHSCSFCNKIFNSYQALGGYLRAHQEEIRARKSWNYPNRPSSSIGITSINVNALSNTRTETSSGAARTNLSHLPKRANSPDFPKQFCSNEIARLNASKFFINNLKSIETQFNVSPILSSGGGSAEVLPSNYLSSTSNAQSSSSATTGFPSNYSMCLGSNGAFQNNTNQFGTCKDGAQFYSMHDRQNLHHHSNNTLWYSDFTNGNPHPDSGSNVIPCFNESITPSSLPCDLDQRLGKDEVTPYNKSNVLTLEDGKRSYFGDVPRSADIINTFKRPKINPDPPAKRETPKKELPLIKDMENSFNESVISSGAKEEDLDLSLHL